MDYRISFSKVEYDRDTCENKEFRKKLFSQVPQGIGSRHLYAIEYMGFEEIFEKISDDEFCRKIKEDFLIFYRTGKFEGVREENVIYVRSYFEVFLGIIRIRLEACVGLPAVIDSYSGKNVVFDWEDSLKVEKSAQIVHAFNDYLRRPEVSSIAPKMSRETEIRVVDYIKYGIVNDEVMFIQAALYYDLRSDFVFDRNEFEYKGRKECWMSIIDPPSCEILEPKDLCFAMKDEDFEIIKDMKYYSKNMYEVYRYSRRRQKHRSVCLPQAIKYLYKSEGIRFYCNEHRVFFCNHASGQTYLVSESLSVQGIMFEFVRPHIYRLSRRDRELLSRIVRGRHAYEQVSIVLEYLACRGMAASKEIVDSFPGINHIFRVGQLLRRFLISEIVICEVSRQFEGENRFFLDAMNVVDLRKWEEIPEVRDAVYHQIILEKYMRYSLFGMWNCLQLVPSFTEFLANNLSETINISRDYRSAIVHPNDLNLFEDRNKVKINLSVVPSSNMRRRPNKNWWLEGENPRMYREKRNTDRDYMLDKISWRNWMNDDYMWECKPSQNYCFGVIKQ